MSFRKAVEKSEPRHQDRRLPQQSRTFKSPIATTTTSLMQKLSLELRMQIYHEVLRADCGLSQNIHLFKKTFHTSLLQVNQLTYAEA